MKTARRGTRAWVQILPAPPRVCRVAYNVCVPKQTVAHGVVCASTLPRINPGDSWFSDHCDISEELSSYMVSPSVNFRVSHGIITTNRQIVRTPNLNEANIFRQTFLWEVVDCHFTLPFVSRVGFSPPCFCLGDGESLCQKGDSPM